jgi:hypothetical protein
MSTKLNVVNTQPKRDTVLFVRIQDENKKFLDKKAKEGKFPDTASYVDALVTKMRKK